MKKDKSILPAAETNVSMVGRIISLLGGFLMMYNSISKRKVLQGVAGSYMIIRGATGYCLASHVAKTGIPRLKIQNINIKTSITVNKPLNEVYAFWRKLDNLPLFMKHLERVVTIDEKTSEWTAHLPGEMGTISWTSEIVEDQLNDRIGWRSLPDSDIENAGNVHFRDAGKFGTEVYAVISYRAPGGKAGEKIGKWLNPLLEEMVKEDIRNFRRYIETSELPTIAGQPTGKNGHLKEKI